MRVYVVKIKSNREGWTRVKVFSTDRKALNYVNDFTDTVSDPRRISVDYNFGRDWDITTEVETIDGDKEEV